MIKEQILKQLLEQLNQRIQENQQAIQSAKDSRDNETKSSVGDKYETGRTLMQLEVEKNRVQLNKNEALKNELSRINLTKKYDKVEFGSLVLTNQHNYFISSALGKFTFENEFYYCISMASPIGKILRDKKVGSTFSFQGKEIEIITIS